MASKASSEKKRQVETGSEEEGKFSKIHYHFFCIYIMIFGLDHLRISSDLLKIQISSEQTHFNWLKMDYKLPDANLNSEDGKFFIVLFLFNEEVKVV